jgi:hypothetical protein
MAFRLLTPVNGEQFEIPNQQFQLGAGQAGQTMNACAAGSHCGFPSK